MSKQIMYFCDRCGKEIGKEEGKYSIQVQSKSWSCKMILRGKSFVLCEECFLDTIKSAELIDEKGDNED